MTFLDSEGVKQLERIVRAARSGVGVMLGPANTHPVGFSERWPPHRPYVPGDDYRRIDWHVFARHGGLFFRPHPLFSDRPVYLLVDCSRSMTTGRPSKWERAVRIAALLGIAALRRSNRVGALGFADGVVAEFPPLRGTARCLKLARFLDQLQPEGKLSDLVAAASRLASRREPGVAIVIGDFFAPESYRRGLKLLQCAGHAVRAVHVCAGDDAQAKLLGNATLCDIESGETLPVDLGQREVSAYRAAFHEFCETIHRFCQERGIGYHRNWEDTAWARLVCDAIGRVVR